MNDDYYPVYNHRMDVPKQKNYYDCGIFVIEFVYRFLRDPPSLINSRNSSVIMWDCRQEYEFEIDSLEILEISMFADKSPTPWFDSSITEVRREHIRKLIIDLASEDQIITDVKDLKKIASRYYQV